MGKQLTHGRRRRPQRLLRFLAVNMAIGVAAGGALTAARLFGGVTDFGDLARRDPAGLIAALLLFCGLSITWGSAAMGTAVFLLPKDKADDADGGGCAAPGRMEPSMTPAAMRPAAIPARRV